MNGEIIIYDEDDNHNYKRIKVGNGTDNVNDLDFVVNKEDIPTQVQADWNQTDSTAIDFVKNKPDADMALEVLAETGTAVPVTNENNVLYTNDNGKLYIL